MPISYTPGNGVLFVHDERALLVHALIDDALRERLWGLVSGAGDDAIGPALDVITTMFGLYQLPPLVMTDGERLVQRGPVPVVLNGTALHHPGSTPWVTHDVGSYGGTLMVGLAGPWWPAGSAVVPASGFSTVIAPRVVTPPQPVATPPAPAPAAATTHGTDTVGRASLGVAVPADRPTGAANQPHTATTLDGPDEPTSVGRPQAEGPQGPDDVLAATCAAGHPTPAHAAECRVCGGPLTSADPVWIPRPVLGALHLPDGRQVRLDRPVVLGRKPEPTDGSGPEPHLVEATGPHVSRVHLEVVVDGWFVLARDLGSTEGSTVAAPGAAPEPLPAFQPVPLASGSVLDLAGEFPLTFRVDDDATAPA